MYLLHFGFSSQALEACVVHNCIIRIPDISERKYCKHGETDMRVVDRVLEMITTCDCSGASGIFESHDLIFGPMSGSIIIISCVVTSKTDIFKRSLADLTAQK